jgi:hypothetical protein
VPSRFRLVRLVQRWVVHRLCEYNSKTYPHLWARSRGKVSVHHGCSQLAGGAEEMKSRLFREVSTWLPFVDPDVPLIMRDCIPALLPGDCFAIAISGNDVWR